MPPSSEPYAEQRAILPADATLHARPAGELVRQASRFNSSVEIIANGRRANAKSILELLALGAVDGTKLIVAASGHDAAEAVSHLAEFLATLAAGD